MKGRECILAFAPSLEYQNRSYPEVVNTKSILKFLEKNNYLVLPTDKNLGQSIVTQEWFLGETVKLLSDLHSY